MFYQVVSKCLGIMGILYFVVFLGMMYTMALGLFFGLKATKLI